MSPRHHGIRTLDDYAYWVDRTIQERGGELVESYLQIEEIRQDDEVIANLYPRQWFTFPHGFAVGFNKLVDADLNVVEYYYQYRHTAGPLIVELHNHTGHEKDVGGRCHMHTHRGDERNVGPAPAYDFDDALHFFAQWPVSPIVTPMQAWRRRIQAGRLERERRRGRRRPRP